MHHEDLSQASGRGRDGGDTVDIIDLDGVRVVDRKLAGLLGKSLDTNSLTSMGDGHQFELDIGDGLGLAKDLEPALKSIGLLKSLVVHNLELSVVGTVFAVGLDALVLESNLEVGNQRVVDFDEILQVDGEVGRGGSGGGGGGHLVSR